MTTIPHYLQPGDTIGLICPAGFMEYSRIETCIQTLEQWGYQVKPGKTIGGEGIGYFSGTDRERLEDLQGMLDDDSIKAILCARGGYGTGRIIEKLDFSAFRIQPKWIIGFSDVTVLLYISIAPTKLRVCMPPWLQRLWMGVMCRLPYCH